MNSAASLYRLLGDEARLRMLRLLGRQRLNVTELTAVLDIAQSGVSRHLGLLKDAGLVAEDRSGGFAYFTVSSEARTGRLRAIWELLESQFANGVDPRAREDDARLHEVLRLRKENFETHGSADRQLVPGRSWAAWARALGLLLPPLTVADLGCGEGYLTIETARWAKRVIAVDRSREVLARARALASRRRVGNITWKRGDIEQLPLADDSVDVALLSQALHHAEDPVRALAEAVRVTVPGGRVLVLDLRAHGEEWVRQRLGDRRLGFADRELDALLRGAGLVDVQVRVGARRTGDPFIVLIACGVRPERTSGFEARGSRSRRSRGGGTWRRRDRTATPAASSAGSALKARARWPRERV